MLCQNSGISGSLWVGCVVIFYLTRFILTSFLACSQREAESHWQHRQWNTWSQSTPWFDNTTCSYQQICNCQCTFKFGFLWSSKSIWLDRQCWQQWPGIEGQVGKVTKGDFLLSEALLLFMTFPGRPLLKKTYGPLSKWIQSLFWYQQNHALSQVGTNPPFPILQSSLVSLLKISYPQFFKIQRYCCSKLLVTLKLLFSASYKQINNFDNIWFEINKIKFLYNIIISSSDVPQRGGEGHQ